jgi:hypothetical protein
MKRATRKLTVAICAPIISYFALGCILLSFERFEGRECLPGRLQYESHEDYPTGLRWIPRSATSWHMVQPPLMVLGNQTNYYVSRGLLQDVRTYFKSSNLHIFMAVKR